MSDIFKNDWKNYLESEFQKDYYINLRKFLINEYNSKTVYPN
ncbi:uracil DNA glycosylase, partial [Clostridium beijerinckii]|nr:uracil DNA glycosylase [Clostridium beijerinckii]